MENNTSSLPLAVTSSSGAGGVSPKVSMLPEIIAEQAQLLERTVKQMMPASPAEAQELASAMKSNLEEMAQSLDRIYGEAASSAQSFNATLAEATRKNVDQALHFLQELAYAKGPSEAMAIQADYMNRQFELFSRQIGEMQTAFSALFAASTKPAQAEIAKSMQRFRSS